VKRNYNSELKNTRTHRYAYDFDINVMHHYMMRTFEPYLRPGTALELGSYHGQFSERLLAHFERIVCVEASAKAIAVAKKRVGPRAQFVHATFERAELAGKYSAVFMTHVLEHLDDPVAVLRRVRTEWLADDGCLFLVCPNAHAASRQIAAKMGVVSHHAAITESERRHGHRITYSFDTLERDVRAAGLRVVVRSGIFFKALANFQWDAMMKHKIVSPEYLEGCYELGMLYPDLCASLFLLCAKR
jgi:2-polyprenyl-3-methyl-5-hydroxy-6-metoxy-1,4-benzoquinol methylase